MTTYTRAQWGARPANGGPGDLTASNVEGIALHWPAMSSPLRTVAAVMAALRGWQNYHMDDKGWSDIAYQVAVDQAGNRYDLRGLVTQSGANGDTDVNERFGAVLLVLAPGEEPTPEMVAEVRRVVADHRAMFPRSKRIVGHADIRPGGTTCPGPATLRLIRAGTFEPTQEDDMPDAKEIADAIWNEKLPTPGKGSDPITAKWAVTQSWTRAGGARDAAQAASRAVADLARLVADTSLTAEARTALAEDIAARVAAEVERMDAAAVAEQLEIKPKE